MWFTEASTRHGPRNVLIGWALLFLFQLANHWPWLQLPYHWDELGYFIPAAHDLYASGAWIPRSTLPNVHPPLVMAYLAGIWKIFGFTIAATRVAMLAIAAATLGVAFLLARRLAGDGAAVAATAMLLVSPPFMAQSMLAHLDLTAALWALLTVYWYTEGRLVWCATAATALALTKETGLIVPLALALLSRRPSLLLPPVAALGGWLLVLRANTGHWLGSATFAAYNVGEALNPWRIPLVVFRRLYQLGFANFHWVASGVILLAIFRYGALRDRRWRAVGGVIAAYVILHSVLGGAILVRYMLPAMALFYVTAGAALQALRPRLRQMAFVVLLLGLAASNWWNPPYSFGYEDNLAVVDFVRLQQQAASWLSEHARGRAVTTAWPLGDALSNPLCGYVTQPVRVNPVENFQRPAWEALDPSSVEIVALYSRSWEPQRGLHRWGPMARLLERHFNWRPQLPVQEVKKKFDLHTAVRWERRGQWMEILVRE